MGASTLPSCHGTSGLLRQQKQTEFFPVFLSSEARYRIEKTFRFFVVCFELPSPGICVNSFLNHSGTMSGPCIFFSISEKWISLWLSFTNALPSRLKCFFPFTRITLLRLRCARSKNSGKPSVFLLGRMEGNRRIAFWTKLVGLYPWPTKNRNRNFEWKRTIACLTIVPTEPH